MPARQHLTAELERDPAPRRAIRIFSALALSGVCAELLSGYAGTTGDPTGVMISLLIFAGLYGAPALLAREVVRRAGRGWPSLLIIFLALGIAQACLIDQSLFSTDYQDYAGWEQTREATLVPALGISLFNAYNFIGGHLIFSFGAPIALAEAWQPARRLESWLGPVGIGVILVAYIGAVAMIRNDPESQSASPTQLVASVAAVLGCLLTAWLLGRRHRHHGGGAFGGTASSRTALRVPVVFTAALVLALIAGLAGEGWMGLGLGLGATCVTVLLVWLASRGRGWDHRQVAAVALSFLVVRGALAFTYFPLAGSVEPVAKYTHNVVMLLIVLLAGWYALRPSRQPAGSSHGAS